MPWQNPDPNEQMKSVLVHIVFGWWLGMVLERWWSSALVSVLATGAVGFAWEYGLQKVLYPKAKSYLSQALVFVIGGVVGVSLMAWPN